MFLFQLKLKKKDSLKEFLISFFHLLLHTQLSPAENGGRKNWLLFSTLLKMLSTSNTTGDIEWSRVHRLQARTFSPFVRAGSM